MTQIRGTSEELELKGAYAHLWEIVSIVEAMPDEASDKGFSSEEVQSIKKWLEVGPLGQATEDASIRAHPAVEDLWKERHPVTIIDPAPFRNWVREYHSTAVYVGDHLPRCDVRDCGSEALYDSGIRSSNPTKQGWGYLCQNHFEVHGMGLGWGFGQRLLLNGKKTRPPPAP